MKENQISERAKKHITSYLSLDSIRYEDVISKLEISFAGNETELGILKYETDDFRNTISIDNEKFKKKVLKILKPLLNENQLEAFDAVDNIEFR